MMKNTFLVIPWQKMEIYNSVPILLNFSQFGLVSGFYPTKKKIDFNSFQLIDNISLFTFMVKLHFIP